MLTGLQLGSDKSKIAAMLHSDLREREREREREKNSPHC